MVWSSLAWRISAAYLALILLVLLGLAFYLTAFTRTVYFDRLEAQLAAEAAVVGAEAAQLLQGSGRSAAAETELQALAGRAGASSGARITLVAADGRVLGDSAEAPAQMDNHATRPEVAAALAGGRGVSARLSPTVGYEMLYVALPLAGGTPGAARAALPLAAVDRAVAELLGSLALAVALAALAAGVLALWLGRTIGEPIRRLTVLSGQIAGGQLGSRLAVHSSDEVGELGRAFNRMADRLQQIIREISAERNRQAAILETVADGLALVDASGRVETLNPAAERLLRVRSAQAVGQPFIAVVRDHELADLLGQPAGEARMVELGLPRRQVRALVAEVPGSGGQRLVLLQDLTELRRLESVRRDFVANVSHELRTPLAAMKAVVETLEAGALDDPAAARGFLARLHDEVDLLANLVRELLELSRIESGQAALRREPTDLAPLLLAAAERFQPLATRAGLELRLELPPELPLVLADPERIRQVLANLLHNAVKFTPAGGWVELRAQGPTGPVSGKPGPGAAEQVQVSVADSGVGIPPGDLERVFERFYKLDRSRSGGGTGLGLAITRHLVLAHGGRIWAESPPGGRGSVFRFSLPRAGEPPEAPEARRGAPPLASAPGRERSS